MRPPRDLTWYTLDSLAAALLQIIIAINCPSGKNSFQYIVLARQMPSYIDPNPAGPWAPPWRKCCFSKPLIAHYRLTVALHLINVLQWHSMAGYCRAQPAHHTSLDPGRGGSSCRSAASAVVPPILLTCPSQPQPLLLCIQCSSPWAPPATT